MAPPRPRPHPSHRSFAPPYGRRGVDGAAPTASPSQPRSSCSRHQVGDPPPVARPRASSPSCCSRSRWASARPRRSSASSTACCCGRCRSPRPTGSSCAWGAVPRVRRRRTRRSPTSSTGARTRASASSRRSARELHRHRRPRAGALAGHAVTANYFRVLGVAPALGRAFTADEERARRAARRRPRPRLLAAPLRRRPRVLGAVDHAERRPATVVGVAPPRSSTRRRADVSCRAHRLDARPPRRVPRPSSAVSGRA